MEKVIGTRRVWGEYSGNVHLITALGNITLPSQPFLPISMDYRLYKYYILVDKKIFVIFK